MAVKRKWLSRLRLPLKLKLKLKRVDSPLTLLRLESHATRAPLETAVEVAKVAVEAVAAIDLAQLEEVADAVVKVTEKTGQQLKAVAAVEATEAEVTVSAEDVELAVDNALATIAPLKQSKAEITRVPIITTEVTKLPTDIRERPVRSITLWTVSLELAMERKT